MHKWETASTQDIQYIVSRPNLADLGKLKFYVLRGQSTLYGHLTCRASRAAKASTRQLRRYAGRSSAPRAVCGGQRLESGLHLSRP